MLRLDSPDELSPTCLENTASAGQLTSSKVSTVRLFGEEIVSLEIDDQRRLCLAQISHTLLKDFSYNEIHNRRVALGITCIQCTPVQLELLRRSGAMPVSSRRCGMITFREAERLCKSFLCESYPPPIPENFVFHVSHACSWGCNGTFHPNRYNSSRAKCIRCDFCAVFFSPNKFIFHSHRASEAKYNPPEAANFNSWRRHIFLSSEHCKDEKIMHAWEDVKAMFNGGTRKRSNPVGPADLDISAPKPTFRNTPTNLKAPKISKVQPPQNEEAMKKAHATGLSLTRSQLTENTNQMKLNKLAGKFVSNEGTTAGIVQQPNLLWEGNAPVSRNTSDFIIKPSPSGFSSPMSANQYAAAAAFHHAAAVQSMYSPAAAAAFLSPIMPWLGVSTPQMTNMDQKRMNAVAAAGNAASFAASQFSTTLPNIKYGLFGLSPNELQESVTSTASSPTKHNDSPPFHAASQNYPQLMNLMSSPAGFLGEVFRNQSYSEYLTAATKNNEMSSPVISSVMSPKMMDPTVANQKLSTVDHVATSPPAATVCCLLPSPVKIKMEEPDEIVDTISMKETEKQTPLECESE